MMPPRRGALAPPIEGHRFPAPWRAAELAESFMVCDASGHPLAYVYFDDEPTRRSSTNRLTRDEVWRVALGIPKLPDFSSLYLPNKSSCSA
jgi:hypothetical protein